MSCIYLILIFSIKFSESSHSIKTTFTIGINVFYFWWKWLFLGRYHRVAAICGPRSCINLRTCQSTKRISKTHDVDRAFSCAALSFSRKLSCHKQDTAKKRKKKINKRKVKIQSSHLSRILENTIELDNSYLLWVGDSSFCCFSQFFFTPSRLKELERQQNTAHFQFFLSLKHEKQQESK